MCAGKEFENIFCAVGKKLNHEAMALGSMRCLSVCMFFFLSGLVSLVKRYSLIEAKRFAYNVLPLCEGGDFQH